MEKMYDYLKLNPTFLQDKIAEEVRLLKKIRNFEIKTLYAKSTNPYVELVIDADIGIDQIYNLIKM